MKRISSIKELKEICQKQENEWLEFFILLNGGLRSSKTISWQEDAFVVINGIDDSTEELNEQQINDDKLTNIGKAIRLGSFYQD